MMHTSKGTLLDAYMVSWREDTSWRLHKFFGGAWGRVGYRWSDVTFDKDHGLSHRKWRMSPVAPPDLSVKSRSLFSPLKSRMLRDVYAPAKHPANHDHEKWRARLAPLLISGCYCPWSVLPRCYWLLRLMWLWRWLSLRLSKRVCQHQYFFTELD